MCLCLNGRLIVNDRRSNSHSRTRPLVSEATKVAYYECMWPKQQYVCMHVEILDDEEQRQREQLGQAERLRRSREIS
jgi:hypothetical protein